MSDLVNQLCDRYQAGSSTSADVLDEGQVAALLDCAVGTVQEKARIGELPAVKFGRSWRFPRGALMQALERIALENCAAMRMRPMRELAVAVPPVTDGRRKKLPRLVGNV